MNKFKYMIFPEHTYILTLLDFDGEPFQVEIQGQEILDLLRRGYALDRFIEQVDKEKEME